MHARTYLSALGLLPLAGAAYLISGASDRPTASGSIQGTITFTGSVAYRGTAPQGQTIDVSTDPYCGAAHSGGQLVTRTVSVAEGGGLRDVVVYVKEGLEERDYPVPDEAVLLDQEGCMYRPGVLALQTGQTLLVRNSDATLHNVHVFAENNRGFNIGQPLKGIESRRRFTDPELSIDVKCDIHGWMHAAIAVFDHPFYSVSAEDGGFAVSGLPPGDYVVEAWHETLGSQTQDVTVTSGRATQISFVFEGGGTH